MIDWLPIDTSSPAPLAGLRVLDLSELLPGPFMTQSLVELGADVIKVERPPHGDPIRRAAPALFTAVNRGKRALRVDLKTEAGVATVLALAAGADVMVESFRPGVIARLGLDWQRLRQLNARLVLASLSGYGATGPRAQWPGHDLNYLAAAGVVGMAMKGDAGSPSFGVPVADLAGATYALAAVQTALLHRVRSGRGQHLDISLTDCAAHWMNPRLAALDDAGGDAVRARQAAQQRPAYGTFRCLDGRALTVAALEDHFWRALVEALPLSAFDAPAFAQYAGSGRGGARHQRRHSGCTRRREQTDGTRQVGCGRRAGGRGRGVGRIAGITRSGGSAAVRPDGRRSLVAISRCIGGRNSFCCQPTCARLKAGLRQRPRASPTPPTKRHTGSGTTTPPLSQVVKARLSREQRAGARAWTATVQVTGSDVAGARRICRGARAPSRLYRQACGAVNILRVRSR